MTEKMGASLAAEVVSIQVGRPKKFGAAEAVADGTEKFWHSAIVKMPLAGPVAVARANLAGDRQADLKHHGGPDKAVLIYASEHFDFWSNEYPAIDWTAGCFGENLTTSGLIEADVCLGDVFRLGSCVLQVSQPRQPCWKLSRRWNLPKLAVRVQQTGLTGWYLRVVQEGFIEAGQTMSLIARLHPEWTIASANAVMFAKPRDPTRDRQLAECAALSASWRETLARRASRSATGS